MSNPAEREETLKFTPFMDENHPAARKLKRYKVSPYKSTLLANDFVALGFGFVFGMWLSGMNLNVLGEARQAGIALLLSLVLIGFFPTYKLYSYHVIFSIREHLGNLCRAVGWASLSIAIVPARYWWPQFFEINLFMGVVFLVAAALMLFSRVVWEQTVNVIRSLGIAFVFIGLLALLAGDETPALLANRSALPYGIGTAFLVLILSRWFLVHVVFNKWMRRHFRRQVLIIGSNEKAGEIRDHIVEKNAPFWIAGIIDKDGAGRLEGLIPKTALGKLRDLPAIAEQNRIEEIIITDQKTDRYTLVSILDYCTSAGINTWFPPKLLPIIDVKVYIEKFCGIPAIRMCAQQNGWVFNKLKHALDAMIALPAFLILLPFFMAIGAAIKLNSRGPVFFKTKAVGKGGNEFLMYKFRSMEVATDNGIHKEYVSRLIKGEFQYAENEEKVFKVTEDPRITSVGRLLRKYSIDELPQIINVLKGEMSLVGPRPCLPYEYELYEEWHKKRLSVRPGITGLWQVAGRSAVTFEDMVLLDLYYVYNRNIVMDFNIMYETIFAVLDKSGAY